MPEAVLLGLDPEQVAATYVEDLRRRILAIAEPHRIVDVVATAIVQAVAREQVRVPSVVAAPGLRVGDRGGGLSPNGPAACEVCAVAIATRTHRYPPQIDIAIQKAARSTFVLPETEQPR